MIKIEGRGAVLIEMLPIVLGVLLALGANEWNEQRIQENRANEALEKIALEIKQNQKFMQKLHENNSRIVDSIVDGVSGEDNQFVPGLQISDTAWDTMIATGVSEHIEY